MTNSKQTIAIVDSSSERRAELKAALEFFYNIETHDEGKIALSMLRANPPSLMIVGDQVPPSGGAAFIRAVRSEQTLHTTPIIFVIGLEIIQRIGEAEQAGANTHIFKPYDPDKLIKKISALLNANIEKEWLALPETPRAALKQSVGVFNNISDVLNSGEVVAFSDVKDSVAPLVKAIENNDFKAILDGVRNHDDYTYAHSMRVATLLSLLGHAAGFKNEEQLLLASGGLLHDVGKMMIPHHILNKPGKLDAAEYEIMKSHVPETIKYLKVTPEIPQAVFIIAEQHHEKIDGSGYPYGLKGAKLNELARMAAVVDVFSALTDRRVYKPPMEESKAIKIMSEEMAGHLDPHYIKLFQTILVDAKVL
jgi:putative nucleotidyltransferase with HDIG domain